MSRMNVIALLLAAAAVIYILRLVRLYQLRSKYALLWVAIAIVLLPFAIAPTLLEHVADVMGIAYAPSALFLLTTGFLFAVVVHFSWELSRLETKVRALAEELALLRADREDEAV